MPINKETCQSGKKIPLPMPSPSGEGGTSVPEEVMSIYEYTPILIYFVLLAAVLGASLGSFLNCAAWRIVHGESFLKGRSHCTTCGHALGFLDLIPVLSWVFLKGKCRYCGEKIPARYPLTELFFAAVSVLCLLRFDLTVLCLRNYIFLCCLFLLTLTDIEDMMIPDGCHIVSVIAWIVTFPFLFDGFGDGVSHIIAAVVYGGGLLAVSLILDRVLGRESLGGGDIKLFAVTGLYIGLIGTLFVMIIACLAGLLFNAVRAKGEQETKAFPFGPWIAGAAALMLLFGDPLINWYIGLL